MTALTVVRTSPKKARTPQRRSLALRKAIGDIAAEYDRLSVRQLFYQLVERGVVDKTDRGYKRVCEASAQMRLSGELDYRKVQDGHRSRRVVAAHNGLRSALEANYDFYRRDYWREQPTTIEVWCEKDALTGVVQPVCDRYAVTYVATRGFPSMTLRYESARTLCEMGKPATIFYFGDHDASGRQISDNRETELRHHGADVTVERVALDPEQIIAHGLPTRPGKATDSRQAAFAARFGNAAVELDAQPPHVLTTIVEACILSAIDLPTWRRVAEVEALERQTLASLAPLNLRPGNRYALTDGAA